MFAMPQDKFYAKIQNVESIVGEYMAGGSDLEDAAAFFDYVGDHFNKWDAPTPG